MALKRVVKKAIEKDKGPVQMSTKTTTTSFVPGQTIWVVNDFDYKGYSKGTVLEVGSSWKTSKNELKFVTKVRIRYSHKRTKDSYNNRTQKTMSFEEADQLLIKREKEIFVAIITKPRLVWLCIHIHKPKGCCSNLPILYCFS